MLSFRDYVAAGQWFRASSVTLLAAGCSVPGILGGGADSVASFDYDGPAVARPDPGGEVVSGVDAGHSVVLVSLDGVRFTDAFVAGASAGLTRLTGDLAAAGTFFASAWNDGVTNTTSGHATLFTGHWESVTKLNFLWWEDRPEHPTIFELAREGLGLPPEGVLLAVGEQKLGQLDHAGGKGRGGDFHPVVLEPRGVPWRRAVPFPLPLPEPPSEADVTLVEETLRFMADHRPRLVALEIAGADAAAHRGEWDGYLRALRQADRLVGQIWDRLQADTAYRDRTYLIVTTDHGRHREGHPRAFTGHGDDCDGCRHIFTLVLGPGVPGGVTVVDDVYQVDVAPTVLSMLGVRGADVGAMEGRLLPLDWGRIAASQGAGGEEFRGELPGRPTTERR